jgi:hypothetical protein
VSESDGIGSGLVTGPSCALISLEFACARRAGASIRAPLFWFFAAIERATGFGGGIFGRV